MTKLPIKNRCSIIRAWLIKLIKNALSSLSLSAPRFKKHLDDFPYIYGLLFFLFLFTGVLGIWGGTIPWLWTISKIVIYVFVGLTAFLFLARPMNAVYGLMGTSGSIQLFFFNFLVITLLFAGIYHLTFFKDAGISYDVNQPHIDYQLYSGRPKVDTVKVSENRDTLFFERQIDTVLFKESIINVTRDTLHYQSIDFLQVWRSTILTTLTQEPAELLTATTVHNSGMKSTDSTLDKQKSYLFEWILIFHIIISWIFFGVFISLLYNKFRYES